MTQIKFVPQLPKRHGKGGRHYNWEAILTQLRKHKGMWAHIRPDLGKESTRTYAAKLPKRFKTYEFASREGKLYARFVG